MINSRIVSFKNNFKQTRKFSILILLIAIVAAYYNTFARIEALGIEAETYYSRYLSHFGLTKTFHILYFVGLESILAIAFAVTGLIVAWHRPATPMTFLTSFSLILYGVTIPPPMHALVVNLPSLPLPLRFIRAIGLGSFVIFFYLFPNGKFTPRWTKSLAIMVAAWSLVWPFYNPLNPYHWSGLLPFIFLTTLLGTGVVAQFYRYFRVSDPQQKQQTKWVVFGLTASVLGDLITHAPWHLFHLQHGADWYMLVLHHPLYIVCQLLVPLSIAFSIMHYGLWEIDFILNRTLIYGLLTAILSTILAITQKTLEKVFVEFMGSGAVILAGGGAGLITIMLLNPIYNRTEKIIGLYFNTKAVDYSEDFIEFLPDVRNVISFSELVQSLVERTVNLTQTEHGVVLLKDCNQGLRLVTNHNLNPETLKSWHLDEDYLEHLQRSEVVEHLFDPIFSILIPLSLPRKTKPELLGVLALGQRTNGRGYSLEEKFALKKLGQEAGLAIYIAQLNKQNKHN
jgi:hypothetical protein